MRALILALSLIALPAYAAPLSSPCTQAVPGAAECDPVNSSNPLPVTGGITLGIPGSPSNAQTGANVVTMQGVNGMVPIAVQSGQCPANPLSKIANAWPFCK